MRGYGGFRFERLCGFACLPGADRRLRFTGGLLDARGLGVGCRRLLSGQRQFCVSRGLHIRLSDSGCLRRSSCICRCIGGLSVLCVKGLLCGYGGIDRVRCRVKVGLLLSGGRSCRICRCGNLGSLCHHAISGGCCIRCCCRSYGCPCIKLFLGGDLLLGCKRGVSVSGLFRLARGDKRRRTGLRVGEASRLISLYGLTGGCGVVVCAVLRVVSGGAALRRGHHKGGGAGLGIHAVDGLGCL